MTTYYNYLGQAMPVSAPPSHYVLDNGGPNGSAQGHVTLTAGTGNYALDTNGGTYDTLVGGNGDDTFYVANITDVVQVASGLTGIKSVTVWDGGYTLPDNVQNLTFFGAGNWGAGNGLANLIVMGGNDHATLDGGGGNDVLVGGLGENDFQFETGLGGGPNHDVFYNFHPAQDTVRITGAGFTSFAQLQAAMTQQTGPDGQTDTVLTIDANDSITFRDTTIAQFQARDFLLPLDMSKLGPLTFDEEFTGLSLYDASTGAGTWQTNYGGDPTKVDTYTNTSNDEKELYTHPGMTGQQGHDLSAYNPFSINQGGGLTITAGRFSAYDAQYTWGQAYYSGMLTTRGVFMQKYGYFDMKAELPKTLGSWPAFWLSQDPYNKAGVEADVLEHLGMYPDTALSRVNDAGTVTGHTTYLPSLSGLHDYGMLWTPTNTTFYIDSVAVMQVATPASWDRPMYMLLNLALGGWGGPIDDSGLPAHMNVQYVRVYGLADNPVDVSEGYLTYAVPTGVHSVTLLEAGQTVTANDAGNVLTSNDLGGAHLIGGAGADAITLGGGGDVATGNGGADAFLLNAVPTTAGVITDFGASDQLDLSGLLASLGYSGSNAVGDGVIRFADDGSGDAQVWAMSGSAWTLAATLDGQASSSLSMNGAVVTIAAAGGGSTGGGSTGGSTGGGSTGGGSTGGGSTGGGSTGGSGGGGGISHTAPTVAGDFSGDGMGDLYWQNTANGMTSVWELNGSSANGVSLPNTAGWKVMDTGNFEGGSYSGDILLRNSTTGMVDIWTDTGGQLAGHDVDKATLDWNIMGTADFNADGKSDILWRNEQNGYVSVWQMDGHNVTTTYNPGVVGLQWHVVGAGDYVGDGKAEVLWRDAGTGEVNLWTIDGPGAGQTHGQTVATIPLEWHVVGGGDFNGDGKQDILWHDSTNGQVVIWEMNGAQVMAQQAVANLGGQWNVVGVVDANGDSKADIVWRDSGTGQTVLWDMNGFNVAHTAVLGTVDNSWQTINHHYDWL